MPYGNIIRNLNNNEGNMSGVLTIQPTAGSGVSDVLVNGASVVSDHKAYINIDVDQTVTEGQKIASIEINGQSTDILIPELNVYDESTGDLITIDDAAAAPVKALSVTLEPQQAGTGDPSPENVRPISGWTECKVVVSPTEDAKDGITYTIQLGSTCYGGELDVKSGVLMVDRTGETYNGSEEGWIENGTGTYALLIATQGYKELVTCNRFKAILPKGSSTILNNGECRISNNNRYINFKFTDITSVDDWKNWLSSNNIEVVYELTTPQEIQLTPTEITLLRGINNLWSDGEVYVKWKVDIEMMLQSIIDSMHI